MKLTKRDKYFYAEGYSDRAFKTRLYPRRVRLLNEHAPPPEVKICECNNFRQFFTFCPDCGGKIEVKK